METHLELTPLPPPQLPGGARLALYSKLQHKENRLLAMQYKGVKGPVLAALGAPVSSPQPVTDTSLALRQGVLLTCVTIQLTSS
eukprot:jgi/Chlat1/7379/Chrsp6S07479